MFAALLSVCTGFVLNCVQSILNVTTVGTGYVDDVTLGVTVHREQKQTENSVFRLIKFMKQLWEQLIFITCGRLELSKCYWVPIVWIWKKGKPKLKTKIGRNRDLFIRESESKELVRIPRKTGRDSDKRLGVFTSCNGDWTKEYKRWKQFSIDFSHQLRKSKLGRIAGHTAYQSMWLAKFRYMAAVVGFTPPQVNQIQKKITSSCLSVGGYCSILPRAVVFGPTEYGGMAWDSIIAILIFEKIKFLIGSIRLQDKVGKMMQIHLTWIQIFAGCSWPILKANKLVTYLPLGWVMVLHQYLVQYQIQVEVWGLWTPSPRRENDRVIMDIVQQQIPSWAWGGGGINRCRLFLNANTLADLTTLDGTYIPEKVRQVTDKLRNNKLLFPIQIKPPMEDVQKWQFFIDLISHNGHVHVPLGDWIRFPDQDFKFMRDAQNNVVFKTEGYVLGNI